MKCPFCGSSHGFKPTKTWSYSGYYVSRYKCPNCNENFNVYEQDGKIKFTVPKGNE